MKQNLKTFFLTALLSLAVGSAWAGTGEELYLVGDATVIGWSSDGSIRQTTRMTETSPGIYVWTGWLKHGGEGFKICNSKGGWDGYRSSNDGGVAMSGSGTDNYQTGDDWKWNPTNNDWQCFTITLNTNNGTLSWEPGVYDVLTPGIDGYISIGTAEDLNKLAFMYRNNINNIGYKVKLTADIDYTAYTNSSLASLGISQTYPFRGEFDGQGHTITIALTNAGSSRTGLFAYINAANIKNLVVEGSATSAGNNCVGGLGGRSDDDGTLIENVVVKTAVSYTGTNGDATCGGFFANMEGKVTLKNCAFYGSINTGDAEGNGGLVGWAGSGANNEYNKCIVAPTLYTKKGNSADFARNNPSTTNCYYEAGDDARLASGEMTYILNGNSSDNVNWFQKLGTDAYPMPFGTDVVYAVGDLYCDGTSKGGNLSFSNTNESRRDAHNWNEWGFCANSHDAILCNELQPNFMEPVEGYYLIGTKQQLNWFAHKVNGHKSVAASYDINGKLTADIDFSDQAAMIGGDGNSVAYRGTFDGQGHKVTLGYAANAHNAALFRTIANANIKNLVTDGTISNEGGNCAGGIFGGSHGASVVENCVSYVTLNRKADGDATFGGIGAYMHDNGKIKNCAFYGSITTPNATGNGGLLGYANGGGNIAVENCIVNAVSFTFFSDNSVSVARNTGNVKHTYVVNAGEATQTEAKTATAEQLASGELAFIINSESESGMAWYQKLGVEADLAPLPFGTAIVYQNGDLYCDGTSKGSAQYSNVEGQNRDAHVYGASGLCTNSHDDIVCNDAKSDYATQEDGYYLLGDQNKLNWFAYFVNQGKGDNANAKLTADINMDGIAFPGIGTNDHRYAGIFDGQKHKISNLTMNFNQQGVGMINRAGVGVIVKNLLIDNTCSFTGSEGVAAFIGGLYGNGGTALIENCGNEATVNATSKNAGALLGCNYANDQNRLSIINSYNTGAINSTAEGGAFSGWVHKGAKVINCYNTGVLDGCEGFIRGYEQTITNCYSTSNTATDTYGRAANYSIDNISDGGVFAVLFAFNEGGVDGSVWRMGDDHPVLYGNQIAMREDCTNRIVEGEFDVKLYRTLKADKWNTFVVPFDLSTDELKAAFGDGVEVAEYSETADAQNAENSIVSFNSMATPEITANVPVMLKSANSGVFSFTGRTVKAGEVKVAGNANFDFVGSYNKETVVPENDYYLSDNKIFKSLGYGSTISATRAYIKTKDGLNARIASFFIDGEGQTTGIVNAKKVDTKDYYNLNGQRVDKAQMRKGLYIRDGRKMVVK